RQPGELAEQPGHNSRPLSRGVMNSQRFALSGDACDSSICPLQCFADFYSRCSFSARAQPLKLGLKWRRSNPIRRDTLISATADVFSVAQRAAMVSTRGRFLAIRFPFRGWDDVPF